MCSIDNIAIIDDDEIYQYASKKIIKSTNRVKNIHVFSNGQEAIDFFQDNLNDTTSLPDLILLDLHMPIIDGWQFLEKYRSFKEKIDKKITIYIITSSMNPDDLIIARGISEVTNYLVKPITLEMFTNILDSIEA